jgi:predicted lysophospholipase L1 biosynthesis ABC-type transport system permease subunit
MHDHELSLFYRTKPLDTSIHVAAVFIFLSVWNWIANNTKPNPIFQFLSYCSRNITSIYLIQWILIMWLMPIFGFRQLGWLMSMMAMAATSFITLSLALLFKLSIKKPK